MSRSPAAFVLTLFTATAAAAPAPKRADPPVYFPTTVGARWVYEKSGGVDEAVEVSEVEKVAGERVVTRKGAAGNDSRYTKVVVTPAGLRQDQFNSGPDTVWVLRTDVKAGGSWDTPEGKRTVTGPERVEVPAGKFDALGVEWEQSGRRMVSWYAPGVGEVKRVEKRGTEEIVFRVLKSFQAK